MDISRRQLLRGRVSLSDLSSNDLSLNQVSEDSEKHPLVRKLDISNECLAFNQVSCRSCEDACDVRAIRFQLQIGKPALPTIDNEQCNFCGECLTVCPSKAISILSMEASINDSSAIKGAQQ